MTHRLPLTMKTVFQDLLLLTFAVPPEGLAALLPPAVHPYERDGRAYISIVVGNMRGMRPGPLPEFLGTNYYQIVYRAVVRLWGKDGREYPGVFFLRSDSNDPVMSYFGNRLTEFRFHYFHTGAINLIERGDDMLVSVETHDKGGDLVAHGSMRVVQKCSRPRRVLPTWPMKKRRWWSCFTLMPTTKRVL